MQGELVEAIRLRHDEKCGEASPTAGQRLGVPRRVLSFVAGLSALMSLAHFLLPDIHRSMTSLALLLPGIGAFCVVGILAARRRTLRVVMALGAILAFGPVAAAYLPQPAGDLRVYSKNLLASNTDVAPIAADILETGPDLVFLQEISPSNEAILAQLSAAFPHQHICTWSGAPGIAVLSRHPFGVQRDCSRVRALAAVEVEMGNDLFWAVSAHVPWPWPTRSAENEEAAKDLLRRLSAPVVVAGDFNSFPWTGRVEEMAAAARVRLAGPAQESFRLVGVPISIDHAMAPGGGRLEQRPYFGSDHAGILADLDLVARD